MVWSFPLISLIFNNRVLCQRLSDVFREFIYYLFIIFIQNLQYVD